MFKNKLDEAIYEITKEMVDGGQFGEDLADLDLAKKEELCLQATQEVADSSSFNTELTNAIMDAVQSVRN